MSDMIGFAKAIRPKVIQIAAHKSIRRRGHECCIVFQHYYHSIEREGDDKLTGKSTQLYHAASFSHNIPDHTGKCIRRLAGIYAYYRYFIDRKW